MLPSLTRVLTLAAAAAIALALCAATVAAQSGPPSGGGQPSGPSGPSDRDKPGSNADLTPENTSRISASLSLADQTCGRRIEPRYRIDCLRQSYLRLAANLPATGDYAPIRRALLDAADKLDRIVRRNLDPKAPVIRPRQGGSALAPRLPPVRAVAPARLAAANRAAEAVVRETELLILRSGRDPKRRNVHYQQIAAAVDNNVLLLRSG